MKKIKLFAILAVAVAAGTLLSCSKDEKIDPPFVPDKGVSTLNETFGELSDGAKVTTLSSGWSELQVKGRMSWLGKADGSERYAYISAEGAVEGSDCETWLLTPALDLNAAAKKTLTFKTSHEGWHDGTSLEVYVLTKTSVEGALSLKETNEYMKVVAKDDKTNEWVETGDVDLSSYAQYNSGIVYVAFRYQAKGGPEQSATIRLDDVRFNSDGSSSGEEILNETLLTRSSFDKFTTFSVKGDQAWRFDDSYGAVMSGYVSEASHENEDWFISPAMNLDGATSATLIFDHARGPATSMNVATSNYTLWISTNYTSGDPTTATWTQLTIPTYGTEAWSYVSAGQIALTQRAANTRFAFKYVCSNTESATWEVKNITVTAVGATPAPMLNFTSADSKNGTINEEFNHTFTVQEKNLTGTTTFEMTEGTLPAGLTLSGATISGTPTATGETTVTIKATNGETSVTQTFTINIREPYDGLAAWNFESATDTSADLGSGTLTAPNELSYTATSKTIYCNGWDGTAGKYWLLTIPVSKDISGVVKVNFIAFGTNTAPKNWKVQISADNSTWTDGSAYTLAYVAYDHADAKKSVSATLPATIPSGGKLYIRLITTDLISINGKTVGDTGNSRLAEVVVGQ